MQTIVGMIYLSHLEPTSMTHLTASYNRCHERLPLGIRRVRIDEDRLKTAAFLCLKRKTAAGMAMVPHATLFFLGDIDVPEPHPVWAVTARHCIEEARAAKAEMAVRVNAGDSYIDIPTQPDDWIAAHDSDVACCFWSSTEGEVRAAPLSQLVAADYTYPFGHLTFPDGNQGWGPAALCVGDEVVFVGLFSQHAGVSRNLPIARFGNVSRLPREPITVKRPWGPEQVEGFLVEARSWGGHSGSPAWWAHPVTEVAEVAVPGSGPINRAERRAARQPRRVSASRERYFFAVMGLVSGHFDIPMEAELTGDVLGSVKTPINSGIAVITPAHFIRRLIDSDEVRQEAEEFRRAYDPTAPATMDILRVEDLRVESADEDPDENQEFENFEDAMEQLVNTPKPAKE
jgi:hypothetical protein